MTRDFSGVLFCKDAHDWVSKIIVMDEGIVIGPGSYKELLGSNGMAGRSLPMCISVWVLDDVESL
jgi:hypothetical protein